ncbi:MAG: methylenetetrahydrofolate reductase [Pseudomonadales bacterium]
MTEHLFSFEFSAPRTPEAVAKVASVHAGLSGLKPAPRCFSVTYGAGGSTKDGTRQVVIDLNKKSASPVAAHLSFGTDDEATMRTLLADYKAAGVTHLVALRGDLPSGTSDSRQLVHANELVGFIRKETGEHFHIAVAAYPESHPESKTIADDIARFKQKVEAGANIALTQYFYNADAYFRYMDLCAAANIKVPIVPGIMPITNYEGLMRFSSICGAEIPRWIEKTLADHADDPAALKSFGDEVVTNLCQRLLDGGAPGLHFYTLNQLKPTLRIWQGLGL